ncbi:phosphoribosyl-ATP diphosphatase [Candidatus Saccharibacteria bacterium]|nr:phosphoribosyl-ATP diphosphatase [Candidatus Saccharibacteria bacterium]
MKIELQQKHGCKHKVLQFPRCLRGVFTASVEGIGFELCRDEDAATLLSAGEVDIAFFGEDKLTEWQLVDEIDEVSIVDSVPIECRMVLAGRRTDVRTIPTKLGKRELLTVATSYPALLGQFACKKGLNLAVTYTPTGSVEAYAARGRTDLIFDIKQTGRTLNANSLLVYREDKQLSLKVVEKLTRNNQYRQLDTTLDSMERIYQTILGRLREARVTDASVSITGEFCRDQNLLVKKYGEESAELLQEFLRRPVSQDSLVSESADLLYVMSIMLAQNGVSMSAVLQEDIRRNEKDRI